MYSTYCKRPLLIALAAVGVLSITLAGGCPAPQTPQQPSNEQTDDTTQDSSLTTPESGAPGRAVTIPTDTGEGGGTTEGGDQSASDGTGGTGGTGSTQVGNSFLRMTEPSSSSVARLTASVAVAFYLNFPTDVTVSKSDLVVARDTNADGVADGDPVHTEPIVAQRAANEFAFTLQKLKTQNLLDKDYGQFVLGAKVDLSDGKSQISYAPGTITVDGDAPTVAWVSPTSDNIVNRTGTWTVRIDAEDTSSKFTVVILLDPDTTPGNGNEVEFAREDYDASTGIRTINVPMAGLPVGDFHYYVSATDGLAGDGTPPFYVLNPLTAKRARLVITDRLNGAFLLNTLASKAAGSRGAIFQGFNFNDLAGSSIVSVPDLNGDGASELLIGARYGKPNLAAFSGQGWGEAYLIYGNTEQRLSGVRPLNAIGASVSGLTFRGIRTPLNTSWSEGLSDITVVNDMDGDNLPELVFSFPRVESLALRESDPAMQHPELTSDIADLGTLEYSAFYSDGIGQPRTWHANEAQFTRGGVVIVSSHNAMLTNPTLNSRKSDRVLDLHEVGQVFSWMKRPSTMPYIYDIVTAPSGCADCEANIYEGTPPDCTSGCADCGGVPDNEAETEYQSYAVYWDLWLGGA